MELLRKKECWKKVEDLGSGTCGRVYLAYSSGSSKTSIAVKSAYFSNMAVRSLLREAKILRQLAGAPNIVDCIGEDRSVEDHAPTYNLLLEHAPLGSLHDVMKKAGPMSEVQVACHASMILTGIAAIHSRGVVHGDLKPGNILAFPGPHEVIPGLKIADFGLSKFVSPESILCGDDTGFNSDVGAIGSIVYEMMVEESVWKGNGNLGGILNQLQSWSFASLDLPEKMVSRVGKDFLFRCLNKNAKCTWSAKDLLIHPFIVENLRIMSEIYGVDVTQFGQTSRNACIWVQERDLFSDSVMEPSASSSYMNATIGSGYQPQICCSDMAV